MFPLVYDRVFFWFFFKVMMELSDDKSLREFWVRCTDTNVLYIHPEKLVGAFEQKYGAQLQSKYNRDPKKGKNFRISR